MTAPPDTALKLLPIAEFSGPPPSSGGYSQGGNQAGNVVAVQVVPWTRVLFIAVICFAVWLVLDAPNLQKTALASPLGSRRTVSLQMVGPIAAVSRGSGLSHVLGWTNDLLGHPVEGGPLLAISPTPNPAGKKDRGSSETNPVRSLAPILSMVLTPTPIPSLPLHPTVAAPLQVLVIGDSIGIDLGDPLINDLINTGVVKATLDGKIDTGLSRPDYFDWPTELQSDLNAYHPGLVVVMMGANDPQGLMVNGSPVTYGTAAWNAAYSARVGTFMASANAAGAHVLWVGMPPMAGSELDSEMNVVNGLVQGEAAARPGGVLFLNTRRVLGDGQGNFTAYLTNGTGSEVNIRTPDGIHLTPDGGEVLSEAVLDTMRTAMKIDLHG